MKRKLLFIIATVFLVAACHNDDYMPGLPAPGNEDNETEMAEQVAGRVALGYVTYYGTSIPDAKYLTHINYAFAELYVKNGIYEKFGLQGDKSRFDKVKNLHSSPSAGGISFAGRVLRLRKPVTYSTNRPGSI